MKSYLPQLADLTIGFQEPEGHYDFIAHLQWGGGKKATLLVEIIPSHLHWQRSEFMRDPGVYRRYGIPVLAAPLIGDKSSKSIMGLNVSYFDLAGRYSLTFGTFSIAGHPVVIEKKISMVVRRTQQSLFATKATRVVRGLLEDPKKTWKVTYLAKEVEVSNGYAHKVVSRMEDLGYVSREGNEYRLAQGKELLHDWAKSHRFGSRDQIRRFVVLGDPATVEARFCEVANRENVMYSLTLFSGAGRRAPFVRYAIAHAYVGGDIDAVVRGLDAKEVGDGGNLVLIAPRDQGVFFRRTLVKDAWIVSDIQIYVDLYNFEARGREQAQFLLQTRLPHFQEKETPEAEAALHDALQIRNEADEAFRKKKYPEAAELYERLLVSLSRSNLGLAEREQFRVQLLLWMSLVHSGLEMGDMRKIETARKICVTDIEVGHLRNRVGYHRGFVELALLAYYAAMQLMSTNDMEKRRYWLKAKTHYDLLNSQDMESQAELAKDAANIWNRLPPAVPVSKE
ncbi:MAG: hypothetical protein A2Z34_01935 [Planctomycetes bacterium RBG_16_59_8]|nr:MAG: hypothetical protein A2Z34_01935 [Planctomycetes bacterium RBG_16_59_8]